MRVRLEKNVMAKSKLYQRHLTSSQDLVTTYEAVRAGFVALALEKNRRATPFIAEARALQSAAMQAKTPTELAQIPEIQLAMLSAAGVSDKAANHLLPEDKAEAIQGLIRNFLEPAGAAFVEELVFRFLLTRGDTLGGMMRNIGGALAQRKLTRAMIANLTLERIPYQWLSVKTNIWTPMTSDNADIELYLRGLAWSIGRKKRVAFYNLTVPLVKNNVDLVLLDATTETLRSTFKEPSRYVALGELKGGIDPAGADEHWKTARTALTRIQRAFAKGGLSPRLFFVGAAIEKKMADEIWEQLQEGTLDNAANLTEQNQTASLARWLSSL